MKQIIEIPANEQLSIFERELNVAAYCRVRTACEGQASSLDLQVSYFTKLINENPNWKLAGIYQDQESGANIENRDALNRMLKDCNRGKIDLILVKSLSRFSRNTLDALVMLEKLKSKNIVVRFESEGIDTSMPEIRRIITAIAATVQEESNSKSQNIKWGIKQSTKKGNVKLNYTNFLGYTKDKDSNLIIVPEEAGIVKQIYSMYLDGNGVRKIKKYLETNGIKTVSGKTEWSTSTIDRILSNEKYCGDVLSRKTYTPDFLTGKQIKNNGKLEQVFIRNNHDAIIGRDMWDRVQEMKMG